MALSLIVALAVSSSSSAWTAEKPAVRAAVLRVYRKTSIDSILIKQTYALVSGQSVHVALRKTSGSWKIVCDVRGAMLSDRVLERRCHVPPRIAAELAADEPVNLLAEQGNFGAAVSAERTVMSASSAPASDTERARMQELRLLNQQMQLQQITRQQAIQQWNQLQYSWSLP